MKEVLKLRKEAAGRPERIVAELTELQAELPTLWEQYIERLSGYMESTGKEYKNHAATIRRWANAGKKQEEPPARNRDYSVGEFMSNEKITKDTTTTTPTMDIPALVKKIDRTTNLAD